MSSVSVVGVGVAHPVIRAVLLAIRSLFASTRPLVQRWVSTLFLRGPQTGSRMVNVMIFQGAAFMVENDAKGVRWFLGEYIWFASRGIAIFTVIHVNGV
jgi:hypothetical protein